MGSIPNLYLDYVNKIQQKAKSDLDKKVAEIIRILNQEFPDPPVPLNHTSNYTLLVAVLLSAQCTDERVNKITPFLYKRADNPYDMIKLDVEEIREIIRPCGLSPRKSKAIKELSQILIDKHGGEVPNDITSLESLPGVGHKTASVVMCQAFNTAAFPVDTHIHRLAWRWGLSNGKSVDQTEKDLKRLFPENTWIKAHLQFIYFGRKFCPARKHDPKSCPICSIHGREELFE